MVEEKVRSFKREIFGDENLILHTADMTRNRNGFERMQEVGFRQLCYERLNQLMTELDYKVIACVIKKDGHLNRYGVSALDPYMFSLEILVERFALEIGDQPNGGEIVAECRSPELDRELALAWENLCVQGTRFVSAMEIRRRISGVRVRSKRENIAGLQLADLVVSPIGRFVLGKWDTRTSASSNRNSVVIRGGTTGGGGSSYYPKNEGRGPLRSSPTLDFYITPISGTCQLRIRAIVASM